jgi:hypothetical protein
MKVPKIFVRPTNGIYNDYIHVSSDYGNTWTAKASDKQWNSVSLSSSGQYQTAVVNKGVQIYDIGRAQV